jgi:hypothetical protein
MVARARPGWMGIQKEGTDKKAAVLVATGRGRAYDRTIALAGASGPSVF